MAANTHDNEFPLAFSKREAQSSLQAPFEMLNKYGRKRGEPSNLESLGVEKRNGASSEMSAVNIIRMAEMKLYLSKSSLKPIGFDSRLACMNAERLKRVLWLLDAAENFAKRQFDQAEKSLLMVALAQDSHHSDHPIERVLAYFAKDLRERIYSERGIIDLEREVSHVDLDEAINEIKSNIHLCEQKLPFSQISHFTGIQTIVDTVGSAERIHFIDIGRNVGSHWILLLDALANRKDCRVEKLKITAVCTPRDNVEETGKLLLSFAESMNFPLVFEVLHCEMYELEKKRVELEAGEVLVLHLDLCLSYLSCRSKSVENLLRGIKSLNPHVMIVNDIEANASGSSFCERFREALFLCAAKFDSQEDCLERDCRLREAVEKLYFQEIICGGVLSDDECGFRRRCNVDFWRGYFSKFGIVETELSQPSIYQASLMIRASPCWSCCTLTMNGKSLLIGWNGIPLRFVSAWRIQDQDNRSS